MKSATVATLQKAPLEILDWAERGDEVCILRDGKAVARLLPARAQTAAPTPTPEHIERHWRDRRRPVGLPGPVTGAELVSWARGAS